MKYTEEELSRILSEHAVGNLLGGGIDSWGYRFYPDRPWAAYPKGCANQVAYNEDDGYVAGRRNKPMANSVR